MKVLETKNDFSNCINPGRQSFFIKLGRNGFVFTIDDLVNKAKHFNCIVLYGSEDIFHQKEEIATLIQKIRKVKPDMTFEIFSNTQIKPIKFGSMDNIHLHGEILLKKNATQVYGERVIENVIRWFKDANADFLFFIIDEDDIDDANMIITEQEIPKNKIFLLYSHKHSIIDFNYFKSLCRNYGYNMTLDYSEVFEVE